MDDYVKNKYSKLVADVATRLSEMPSLGFGVEGDIKGKLIRDMLILHLADLVRRNPKMDLIIYSEGLAMEITETISTLSPLLIGFSNDILRHSAEGDSQ